ncbi:MAG: Zn-ribbon domain-containing OB-fold protein [Chloroflexi bacterium]|nr:MAG: Zn-ribbon domain-containing OB-fold protein [Chloroflexota bacterium]
MNTPVAEDIRPFNHTGFYQYLAERRLMAARCATCGEINLPPRALCPRCFGTNMEWIELSGEGQLEGFTLIHVGLPAMAAEGYNRQNPYCSGVVRLAEGPAVAAQIVGEDGAIPTTIEVGMPLRVVFFEIGKAENRSIALVFKP